jgi:hypothetical protein
MREALTREASVNQEAIVEDAHTLELVALRREITEPLSLLVASLAIVRHRLEWRPGDGGDAAALLAAVLAAQESANQLVEIVRRVGAFDLAERVTELELAEFVRHSLGVVEPELERRARIVTEFEFEPHVIAAPRGLRKVLSAALAYVSHQDDDCDELPAVCVRVERSGPAAAVLAVQADLCEADSGNGTGAEVSARLAKRAALTGCRRIVESFEGALVVGSHHRRLVRIFLKIVPAAPRCS